MSIINSEELRLIAKLLETLEIAEQNANLAFTGQIFVWDDEILIGCLKPCEIDDNNWYFQASGNRLEDELELIKEQIKFLEQRIFAIKTQQSCTPETSSSPSSAGSSASSPST